MTRRSSSAIGGLVGYSIVAMDLRKYSVRQRIGGRGLDRDDHGCAALQGIELEVFLHDSLDHRRCRTAAMSGVLDDACDRDLGMVNRRECYEPSVVAIFV